MKDVIGYEGLYAVTSCGKVWSCRSKKFLKPIKKTNGYLVVSLCKDKKAQFYIHRLVAEAYIENPNNLESVDHIDGNKEHNYVGNLQWMTLIDNSIKGHNKPIKCTETGKIFKSGVAAAKEMGLHATSVSAVCRGKLKTTGGYHFEFIKE